MKNRLLAGMLITALAVQTAMPFEMGMVYAEEKENIAVENEEIEMNGVESGECGNNVTYTLDSNGLLTITAQKVQNRTQYAINAHAFNGRTDIKKIKIESGVTEIGDYAFVDAVNLENIEIPDTIKSIGELSFNNTGLSRINIPENAEVGESAFRDCTKLTIANFKGDTLKTIGDDAFKGCSSLKSVNFPASVGNIGEYAFANCTSLTEVTLPEVKTTWAAIFENCTGLKKVTFPKTASSSDTWGNAFRGCKNLETVDLGGATEIPYCGFISCTSLKEITIPNTVKTIRRSAFNNTSLQNIVIPEGVQKIEQQAFAIDTLESISFPSTVTDIDFETGLCHSSYTEGKLKSVTVAEGNPAYDSRNNCNAVIRKSDNALVLGCMGTTEVPEGVTSIINEAFSNASPSSIIIPNSVTYVYQIPSNVIYCRSDSYVYTAHKDEWSKYPYYTKFILLDSNTKPTKPNNNNNKNNNSNKNNNPNNNSQSNTVKKGTTIRVKDNKYKVTGKNTVTFTGLKNSKVKKVTVPNTVKYKGKTYKVTAVAGKALKGKNVTRVKIGDNVKTIDTSAMENCKKLTSVTLGKNVNKIGKYAFKSDKKLKTVTIKSKKLKSVGKNAFKGIHSNAKMKVPSNKKSAYKKLMKGAGLGKKVKIVKG